MFILLTATVPDRNNGWWGSAKIFRYPNRALSHFPCAATMSRGLAVENILAIMCDQ
jgi:hypothetical protein